ncbi:MAG: DUF2058 domain-containing protein [Alcanivoracaceae bacterium]|jgi:hypothetical protein|nr:DUF2058 domain-containing protein [Alcanivoracaceae bacterium]
MAKSLQEQLIGAGLVKKNKTKALRRAQQQAARGNSSAEAEEARRLAEEARQEKVARDKALNQEKNAQAQRKAINAQIVQLVETHQVTDRDGDIAYKFTDGKKIKTLYVNGRIQSQLVDGVLAIVRTPDAAADTYHLLPRAVAEKIAQRDGDLIVAMNDRAAAQDDSDDPYAAFKVPDDLMW